MSGPASAIGLMRDALAIVCAIVVITIAIGGFGVTTGAALAIGVLTFVVVELTV